MGVQFVDINSCIFLAKNRMKRRNSHMIVTSFFRAWETKNEFWKLFCSPFKQVLSCCTLLAIGIGASLIWQLVFVLFHWASWLREKAHQWALCISRRVAGWYCRSVLAEIEVCHAITWHVTTTTQCALNWGNAKIWTKKSYWKLWIVSKQIATSAQTRTEAPFFSLHFWSPDHWTLVSVVSVVDQWRRVWNLVLVFFNILTLERLNINPQNFMSSLPPEFSGWLEDDPDSFWVSVCLSHFWDWTVKLCFNKQKTWTHQLLCSKSNINHPYGR